MGDAGGHLADSREFSGLYQFILGAAQSLFGEPAFADLALEPFVAGAQVGGAFGNPTLQLIVGFLQGFPGCEAGGDHLAPLVPGDQKERQEGKRHGHQDPLVDRFAAQVLEWREQGEIPRRIAQGPGLRQIADVFIVGHQFAVGREREFFHAFGQGFPGQRLQFIEREPVVLQAAGEFFLGFFAQRHHRFQAPRRIAGQNDDAVFVADEGFQASPLPAFFHGFQANLDHGDADDLAVFFQAMGQVVTGFAVGAADAIETPRLTAHGVLEIGAKGQVFTQVTVDIAPVAGGHDATGGVHHVDGPTAAAPVQAFEVIVDRLSVFRVRVGQQLRNAGFEFQQAGQVGVFADFAFDGARVQFQLALAVFAEAADAVVLTDPEADIAQADHHGDDQWRQEQMTNQTGFHGE
ncbi:hypothetical protein PS647_06086 [Pseudomonas fluorescens]|nr:hypothetical protein PS647_06086 [Pseudomonas fluorescens]